MRVEVLQRHIDAARETNRTAGRGAECPVRLALAELLPGHSVSKPLLNRTWLDGRPVAVPAGAFQWCLEFDADEPVQPFGFEFDPAALVPGAVSPEADAFHTADAVIAFADPESGLPLCEFMRSDAVGPVRGFANIFDKQQMAVLYRVSLSDGPDAAVSVELTKLRPGSGDCEARSYRVMCSTGGELTSCECRGALRWGKPCKHAKSLRQWVCNGLI